jgi:hypothetical protein
MPWIYALELLLIVGCLWRIGSRLGSIAHELRDKEDDDDE